jgi:hypothetical protein
MGDGRASTPGRMPTARAFFRDTISPSGLHRRTLDNPINAIRYKQETAVSL